MPRSIGCRPAVLKLFVTCLCAAVVGAVLLVAWPAAAEPAGVPIVPSYALAVDCPEPDYPDDISTGICLDADDEQVDMQDGTRPGRLQGRWRGDPESGKKWAPSIYYTSGGSFGAGYPYVVVFKASGGSYYIKPFLSSSNAGSAGYLSSPFVSGKWPDSGDGFSSGSGTISGYVFTVSDPESGDCSDEWDDALADWTEVNVQAWAGCVDPGEEPPPTTTTTSTTTTTTTIPPDPSLRVYLPDGRIDPDATVTMLLEEAPAEEPVSCVAQGGALVTGSPSEGSTDVDGFYDFELVWSESGAFAVECSWGDPVESARVVVTIGSGLDDVLGGECDCGAWWHIGCHTGCVLKWAFVPEDPDAQWGVLQDSMESAFPFSLFADVAESIGSIGTMAENGTARRDLFTIPFSDYLDGEGVGGDLSIMLPDLSTPGSPGPICSYTGTDYACNASAWNVGPTDEGGIGELWGFRTYVRLAAEVLLYVAWAFAAWKWADGKLSGGGGAG